MGGKNTKEMAVTETETIGYGSRVGSSFKAMGFGALLVLAGIVLLWWNEGRTVHRADTIAEAQDAYVEMDNISTVDPSFAGKLVHATGTATTSETLNDYAFGISVNAIALEREVEYYQWDETKKTETKDNLGGSQTKTTTYDYKKRWCNNPVKDDEFKDEAYRGKNFTLRDYKDEAWTAEVVNFGAYKLSKAQISSIGNAEDYNVELKGEKRQQWNEEVRNKYKKVTGAEGVEVDDAEWVHTAGNVVYFGKDPENPQIGDIRVTFSYVKPTTELSTIAVVSGTTFAAFHTKTGDFIETSVGIRSAGEMFTSAEESNNFIKWLCRLGGFLLIYFGLKNLFGLLVTILKVVPALASIMNFGVGIVCGILAAAISLVVIAIAWFFYRPILSICLLAVAGFLVWVFAFKGKDKLKELANRGKQPAEAPVQQ